MVFLTFINDNNMQYQKNNYYRSKLLVERRFLKLR